MSVTKGGQYDAAVDAFVSYEDEPGAIYTLALDQCGKWTGDATYMRSGEPVDLLLEFRDRCHCYDGMFVDQPVEVVDKKGGEDGAASGE